MGNSSAQAAQERINYLMQLQSTVTHLALTQNLPRNSSVKLKYTNFKTEVDMRYSNNFAKINDLTADEYQLSLTQKTNLGQKRLP